MSGESGRNGTTAGQVLRRLATRAMGLTGADVERAVREARLKARREKRRITYADLEAGIRGHRPTLSYDVRWRLAIHESGHAVVHHALRLGAVLGLTIDARDGGQNTITFGNGGPDTVEWYERLLALLMAGRAAELIVLKTASAGSGGAERDRALAMFYDKWKDEALVVDKWFRVQATSDLPGAVSRIEGLLAHPAFDLKNPNRARSVLHAFALENPLHFHAANGSGYALVAAKVVELDRLNPQIASRLARAFDRWRKYDEGRQRHARAALESIAAAPGLSPDVSEVVGRALG